MSTEHLGLLEVNGRDWLCHDCYADGHGGKRGAVQHVRVQHRGEPYMDLCGWCTRQVPVGEMYCSDEHAAEDQRAMDEYMALPRDGM